MFLALASMLFLLAGFSKQQLAKVLSGSTMVLARSWDGKLQPVLAALEGVLGSRQAVVAAVSRAPDLLGISYLPLTTTCVCFRQRVCHRMKCASCFLAIHDSWFGLLGRMSSRPSCTTLMRCLACPLG